MLCIYRIERIKQRINKIDKEMCLRSSCKIVTGETIEWLAHIFDPYNHRNDYFSSIN